MNSSIVIITFGKPLNDTSQYTISFWVLYRNQVGTLTSLIQMSLKLLRISVSVPFAILDCASVVTPNTAMRNPCTPETFLALLGN